MITKSSTLLLESSLVFLLIGPAPLRASDLAKSEVAPSDCCRTSSPDIQQHLKTADRLYAQFKPKEARSELQKVLQEDPTNVEAILKLSRAYIDIGDSIPE